MKSRKSRFLIRALIVLFFVGIATAATYFIGQARSDGARGLLPTLRATAVAVDPVFKAGGREPAPTATVPATFTPIPTLTSTPPPAGATARPRPTRTSLPTQTASPTATPTPLPQFINATGTGTPTPQNTAVPTLEIPAGVTNILLLGSDAYTEESGGSRTDTMIVASVNQEEKTASMLSVPRDLYVSIPGWRENRINTAVARGDAAGYPGGGVQLLKDTLLYNFGIPIHYYARVDFNGFQKIIDAIGGVEIAVSCELHDWILKEPGLDITVEENYEMYTLEPGIHTLDGHHALWYARSRRTTSDFDRGRRQQQMLRAVLNRGVDLDLVSQFPTLWEAFNDTVETDMDVGRALQLAAIAPAVRDNGIQHLYLTQGELRAWTVPETGAQVQLLNWEEAKETVQRLYAPPSLNRSTRSPIFVEIINATDNPDMAHLAADNLAWYGFAPVISADASEAASATTLEYHGANFKGSFHWLVSWIFNMGRGQVELKTDSGAVYDYKVTLGTDYDPCRNPLYAPRPSLEGE